MLQLGMSLTMVLLISGTLAQAQGLVFQGLVFNEQSPIYEVPPQKALDLTDEVTLEAWVQADPMPAGRRAHSR